MKTRTPSDSQPMQICNIALQILTSVKLEVKEKNKVQKIYQQRYLTFEGDNVVEMMKYNQHPIPSDLFA